MTDSNDEIPTIEPLLGYQQVSERLGVDIKTVYSLVKSGKLVAVKFGRSVRFTHADLALFITKHRTAEASESDDV